MPNRDGSGPWGRGPLTGRGMGPCCWPQATSYAPGNRVRMNAWRTNRRGFGSGIAVKRERNSEKDELQQMRDELQSQLDLIEKRLENI